ncbi:MAG: hypothetical protein ACFFCO_12995 [Promethearchaeota archaeon]
MSYDYNGGTGAQAPTRRAPKPELGFDYNVYNYNTKECARKLVLYL